MSAASASPAVGSPAPAASLWVEHRNAQGRVYWYHTAEKRSVWSKPTELKTARERAIDSTPWREYQSGERKYYVHSETKETTWTLPKELKDLFDSIPDEPAPAVPANALRNGSPAGASPAHASPMPVAGSTSPGQATPAGAPPLRPVYSGPPPGGEASPALRPPPAGPSAMTMGAAPPQMGFSPNVVLAPGQSGEDAFIELLRSKGVDASWTWEQTMRHIITDPMYKALKSLAERKAAFTRFVTSLKERQEELKRERIRNLEPAFKELARRAKESGNVKPYASFESAKKKLGSQEAWKALESVGELETRGIWDALRREWREAEEARIRELRHRNMDMLMSLLRTFEADVLTRWKDAHRTVVESAEWAADASLRSMDVADMVTVFEEHIRSLEREKENEVRDSEAKRKREERKRRDAFRARLTQLRDEGVIQTGTSWPDVYPHVKDDANFEAMLGQPGSTPLDLFFDVVDELEAKAEARVAEIEDLLRGPSSASSSAVVVQEDAKYDDFVHRLRDAAAASGSEKAKAAVKEDEELPVIFEQLVARATRIARDERRRVERKVRHIGEDLRYAFRKAPLPLEDDEELSKGWEHWRPRLAEMRLRDWEDLGRIAGASEEQVEEARRGAWERFVRRQKEKNEERRLRSGSLEPAPAPAARGKRTSVAPEAANGDAAPTAGGDRRALRASRRRAADEAALETSERPPRLNGDRNSSEPQRKRARKDDADSEVEEGEA